LAASLAGALFCHNQAAAMAKAMPDTAKAAYFFL
jgi:hypothetical protein